MLSLPIVYLVCVCVFFFVRLRWGSEMSQTVKWKLLKVIDRYDCVSVFLPSILHGELLDILRLQTCVFLLAWMVGSLLTRRHSMAEWSTLTVEHCFDPEGKDGLCLLLCLTFSETRKNRTGSGHACWRYNNVCPSNFQYIYFALFCYAYVFTALFPFLGVIIW